MTDDEPAEETALPLPGPRVRLDVHTDSDATATRVAETLIRIAVGYASEGMVAGIIVIPTGLEVDVADRIEYDDG